MTNSNTSSKVDLSPTVALPTSQLIGVGADVTWCHSSSKGRSIGFTTRRGKIISIDRGRDYGCAKYRGKLVWLPIHRFRSASARSELTEMVMGEEPNRPQTPTLAMQSPASGSTRETEPSTQ